MSRLTELKERLKNLKAYMKAEKQSENPSQTYISDLAESIKYCEREIANGAKDYEFVNGVNPITT